MPRRQTIFAKGPLLTLEQEFQRHLHDARIVCRGYITESALAAVVDESIRILKLRMIEDVEGFCPKLQFGALGDGRALQLGN